MARIAVDAMGGDNAPGEVIIGAINAAARGADVVLVGDAGIVGPLLKEAGADLPVVHAPEVIGMDEDPSRAIREKKGASVTVAARLVADGEADGVVSAGSTGAAVAAAALVVGRLPGTKRPAIANIYPVPGGGIVVLDGGANIECRPEHLQQFGVMGAALAEVYLGKEKPRVGLLNIGEEEGKGRALERDAYALLADSALNFVGNVEGHDVATNAADVFVTDGFTGNVLLKGAEGTARWVLTVVNDAILGDERLKEAAQPFANALQQLRDMVNPEWHGGAHLVGVKGVVVISHGASRRTAIGNSVALAVEAVERGLVERIADGLRG